MKIRNVKESMQGKISSAEWVQGRSGDMSRTKEIATVIDTPYNHEEISAAAMLSADEGEEADDEAMESIDVETTAAPSDGVVRVDKDKLKELFPWYSGAEMGASHAIAEGMGD